MLGLGEKKHKQDLRAKKAKKKKKGKEKRVDVKQRFVIRKAAR